MKIDVAFHKQAPPIIYRINNAIDIPPIFDFLSNISCRHIVTQVMLLKCWSKSVTDPETLLKIMLVLVWNFECKKHNGSRNG